MLLSYGFQKVVPSWNVVEEKAVGYVRMYYVLGGEVVYESGREWKKLKKDMLYCFPNKVSYKITHNPENPLICLHLHANITPYVLSELREINLSGHPVLKKMLEAFIVLWKEEQLPLTDMLVQQMMAAVLEYMKKIRTWEMVDAKIEKSVIYIMEHLDRSISIEELSTYCGYQQQYFIRLFKACMGLTPHQFMTSCRMKNAVVMLSTGNSVAKTAENLGYKDSKNFSKVFKQVYGISPKEVKKKESVLI